MKYEHVIKTIQDFNLFIEKLDVETFNDEQFDGIISLLERTDDNIQEIMDCIEEEGEEPEEVEVINEQA